MQVHYTGIVFGKMKKVPQEASIYQLFFDIKNQWKLLILQLQEKLQLRKFISFSRKMN